MVKMVKVSSIGDADYEDDVADYEGNVADLYMSMLMLLMRHESLLTTISTMCFIL